ncbi:MAG: glycosyltransferase family 1 protein [bacterium]|nr:glycosyltransferase family 1 protein [bacterium]
MRIAIDCRTILNPGFGQDAGVGHYTYYLVWHLLRSSPTTDFVLFFDKELGQDAIDALVGDHSHCKMERLPFSAFRRYVPGLYSHFLISAAIARQQPDLLHVPGGGLPLTYKGKTVLTVHDLAIFRHPEWFPSQLIATKLLYPKSLRQADHLIVPSKQTAKDLKEIFKIKDEKISVIYEGVVKHRRLYDVDVVSKKDVIDIDDLTRKYGVKQPYIFCLGTIEPRKNLEFLLETYELWRKQNPSQSAQLVLAGGRGWKYGGIFKKIDEVNNKYSQAVNYLGYAPHQDKWALLENAACFVFPSLYEGFGLPVLEAMASGTPVIASQNGSLPEVVGRGGLMLKPDDHLAWVKALEKIIGNLREQSRLIKEGKKQAEKFTWENCAEKTLEVYRKLTG